MQIPTHWTISSDRSRDPLLYLRCHEFGMEESVKAQSHRLNLLGICKSLQPIAQALLFSEVCLTNMARVANFVSMASIQREDGHYRGDLTRRMSINIFTGNAARDLAILDSVKTVCPNLVALHIFSDGLPVTAWKEWMETWKDDIRTLTWCDFGLTFEDIFTAAARLTHLTSFHVTSLGPNDHTESTQIISLPFVRRLVINSGSLQNFDISKLSLPALEWLYIDIADSSLFHRVEDFIGRHAETITGLEFMVGAALKDEDILSDTILSLQSLKTVILTIPVLSLPAKSSSHHTSHVQTLYLRVNDPTSTIKLPKFISDIKISRFPLMEDVIIVVNPRFDKGPLSDIHRLEANPPSGLNILCREDPTRCQEFVFQPWID